MFWFVLLCLVLAPLVPPRPAADFLKTQQSFPRVRNAYAEKGAAVDELLADLGLRRERLYLLLVAYKEEQQLEVWAKRPEAVMYHLLTTYPVCASSGRLGPKRAQGDEQTPEGFYYLDRFNPASNYHLSLGINYPNALDRLNGEERSLGGNIFIHGKCVTVGCLPITDAFIKELYVLAVEARANGQRRIPVYLFPNRLTDNNLQRIKDEYATNNPVLAAFWDNLKVGYDSFTADHRELHYACDRERGYVFR